MQMLMLGIMMSNNNISGILIPISCIYSLANSTIKSLVILALSCGEKDSYYHFLQIT